MHPRRDLGTMCALFVAMQAAVQEVAGACLVSPLPQGLVVVVVVTGELVCRLCLAGALHNTSWYPRPLAITHRGTWTAARVWGMV